MVDRGEAGKIEESKDVNGGSSVGPAAFEKDWWERTKVSARCTRGRTGFKSVSI